MENLIIIKDLKKSFDNHEIFLNISLEIKKGECISFIGESGKGKTTLLNIIGLLENYDSGTYLFEGQDVATFKEKDKRKLFKREIGFLFQNFALIDNKTVRYNLEIAFNGHKSEEKIKEVLNIVGLKNFENKKIFQLSGGEQQRVALARLLIKDSKIILADEPTGSLDEKNRNRILKILEYLKKEGKTIVVVTHDKYVSGWCDKVYKL